MTIGARQRQSAAPEGDAKATLMDKLPTSRSFRAAEGTWSPIVLRAANQNDPVHADCGDDDAMALAEQLREQVLRLYR
jgi:hypothetical protein